MTSVEDAERTALADSTVVIACAGPENQIRDQVRSSLELGARSVVVDLGDAEMVDSSTLTALKQLGGELRSKGGGLSVVSTNPGLSSLLHMTLLSRSFRVFRSLDEALGTSS